MKTLLLVVALVLASGCSLLPRKAGIKLGEVTVTPPKDNGTGATVNTSDAGTTLTVPAGSKVTQTTTEAQPAVPAQANQPAQPAKPAVTVVEITPAAPMEIRHTEKKVQADTGTVDTSVRKHQIDVQDRAKLLWFAIGCAIAGIVLRSMLPGWAGLSNAVLLAAAILFGAWKFAEIPWWAALIVVGIMGAKALGYKRAQWDANGDGIPDILQGKQSNGPQP